MFYVQQSHNITDLQPYQSYHVQLRAYNEGGDGPGDDFSGKTDEEGIEL
jgi:Fibronectin type III domain